MERNKSTADEQRRLPAHELRRLSVAAGVDPRTVARVIAGAPTKGLMYDRVVKMLREQGLEQLVPGVDHG
jgi:hypothetical protein